MKLYLPALATLVVYPKVSQAWSMGPRYYGFSVCTPNQLMQKQQEMIQKHQDMLQKAFTRSFPRYEVIDEEEKFQISLDVPGVEIEDIEVNFDSDESTLSVRGRRSAMNDSRSYNSQFSERFFVDPSVNVETFTASLKNGVLVISAPKDMKKIEEKNRKIPISEVVNDVFEFSKGEAPAGSNPKDKTPETNVEVKSNDVQSKASTKNTGSNTVTKNDDAKADEEEPFDPKQDTKESKSEL